MAADPVDDEQYHSASDEDFNPDVVDPESESSSEDETVPASGKPSHTKRKRNTKDGAAEVELDSGDEATIQERRRKKRKASADNSDDEGGEGGLIKTRAQRRQEKQERRPLARIDGATIDVDSLWARLSSLPVGRAAEAESTSDAHATQESGSAEYITIKRTTKFAGEVSTEERTVLKSSKEAQIYLQEQEAQKRRKQHVEAKIDVPEAEAEDEDVVDLVSVEAPGATKPSVRRPLRRYSRFEPNPTGEVRALPPHLQLKWPRNKRIVQEGAAQNENTPDNIRMPPPKPPAAAKLNVVQKSRHDWAGYVDQAGIAEELDEHGKSKQSYLDRTEFLNRMEGRREADRLEAKAKVV